MMKIVSILEATEDSELDRPAIVTRSGTLSFREVAARVARLVKHLNDRGARPGQRAVAIADHDEHAIFLIAAASAIGLQLLIPYNLEAAALDEWTGLIGVSKPDHVIYCKADRQLGVALETACSSISRFHEIRGLDYSGTDEPLVVSAPQPIENFFVLFSSGTTSKPKAISISESLICTRIVSVSGKLAFERSAQVFLSGLMNNTTGVLFSFGALLHGATLHIPDSRRVEDWPAQVARVGVTHLMLRPVAMQRFIEAARQDRSDLRSLRVVAYGAAALSPTVLQEGRALMPCAWVQGYGLSETFGPFCWLTERDHAAGRHLQQVYCVGTPDETLEVCLDFGQGPPRGVGEVVLRGLHLMRGYLDVESGGLEPVGEWFHTGDYAEFSEQGELVLKGRVATTLLSQNGHRIYPEEVESVIKGIPGVAHAVLLGWATGKGAGGLSTAPVACVFGELSRGKRAHVRDVVVEHLSRRLSKEKWPEYLFACTEEPPVSANGKISAPQLLKMMSAESLIQVTQETVS